MEDVGEDSSPRNPPKIGRKEREANGLRVQDKGAREYKRSIRRVRKVIKGQRQLGLKIGRMKIGRKR